MVPSRGLLWLWVVAIGGCGAGVEIGGQCSLENTCESGAICDFTDPGGPVCIDADGDLDGDGIPNGMDFCEHAPGGAFDEDRDGVGDECDRCPIAPPPATPDADNDDVDAPCDPEPTEDGDQLVAFDGFNNGLPANWTASDGVTFVGGEAVATPADPVAFEQLVAPLPLVSQHMAVLVQYRVDSVDPQATAPFAGIVALDQRPAGGTVIRCGGARTGTSDRLLLDADAGTASDDFMTSLFDSAGLYRLALQVDNASAGCAIVADLETGAAQATSTGEVLNQAGFAVRGAVARFQYVMVVQRNPAPPPP